MNIPYNMSLSPNIIVSESSSSSTHSTESAISILHDTTLPSPRKGSIYKGISNRPFGWKVKHPSADPATSSMAKYTTRKWDGTEKKSTEWDGLRKDPELWLLEGDCLVHLYAHGQSQRGPAFKIPLAGLRTANCQPLLDRVMVNEEYPSHVSTPSRYTKSYHLNGGATSKYKLYLPAPANTDRVLYHTAARNFFAWVFGRSLVGIHLGAALVALLNSMNEFRTAGTDNVDAIMGYMTEEGYGDMRNQPDHALGILYFAEKFRFKDLWMDAFAHCAGMNERLGTYPGYEYINRSSRALITRSRIEMDMRLEDCGRRLGSFLSDDISEINTGLSSSAHAHLDKFRTFLQSYFVGKLGYYPPTSSSAQNATFPKHILGFMCSEFETLYEFLMDKDSTPSDALPTSHFGGISVNQIVETHDQRHGYKGLLHQLPLLPEVDETMKPKAVLKLNLLSKNSKMKPDARLIIVASLLKATNRADNPRHCGLVHAYKAFERDIVFSSSPLFDDKNEKLSPKEARKVRWILIYAILQTLLCVTRIPDEVNDIHNVPYNLCIQKARCPPWKEQRAVESVLHARIKEEEEYVETVDIAVKTHSAQDQLTNILPEGTSSSPRRNAEKLEAPVSPSKLQGTVKNARLSLGNMPELQHPQPKRASHEIVAQGYGTTSRTPTQTPSQEPNSHLRELSSESESSSIHNPSSRWSNSSLDGVDGTSPSTSVAGESRRGSSDSVGTLRDDLTAYSDSDHDTCSVGREPGDLWDERIDEESFWKSEPLRIRRSRLLKRLSRATAGVKLRS